MKIEWTTVDIDGDLVVLPIRENQESGPNWLRFPNKTMYQELRGKCPSLPAWEELEKDDFGGRVLHFEKPFKPEE